jgi:hypothetical protein
MSAIKDKILQRIKTKKRGWVFCAKDFADLSTRNTIDKNLTRLIDDGFITRIDWGIYYYPVIQKDIGIIPPSIDDIAKAIAHSLGVSIFPSGAVCANILGFSNQVPAQNNYLTTGRSFKRKIGNNVICFKHTKINPPIDAPSKIILILNALSYLGKNNITDDILNRCASILNSVDKKYLTKMSSNLSSWMADIIYKLNAA